MEMSWGSREKEVVCVCARAHVCARAPEVNRGCLSPGAIHMVFGTGSFIDSVLTYYARLAGTSILGLQVYSFVHLKVCVCVLCVSQAGGLPQSFLQPSL